MTRRLIRVLIFAAIPLAAIASVAFGSVSLGPERIFAAISGRDSTAATILLELRLPRLLGALTAGVGLAGAGLLLQTVTDNDLCAPNIIGVNSGAGLAVMAFLAVFPEQWRYLPLAAFAGALAATLIVLAVAKASGEGSRATLVLAGVAVSSAMSAGISYLSIRYPDALVSYTGFTVGGLSGVTYERLALPAAMIASSLAASGLLAPSLGLLRLGEETASSLGVRVRAVRFAAVLLASVMCAAVVSFAGLLGFVGLIVPHIARRLTGSNLRGQLVLSAALGALLVTLADLAGRVLTAPGELPAGVVTALIGAPFFVWLLLRRR